MLVNGDLTIGQYKSDVSDTFAEFKDNIIKSSEKMINDEIKSGKDRMYEHQFSTLKDGVSTLNDAFRDGTIGISDYFNRLDDSISAYKESIQEARELENAIKSVQKTMDRMQLRGFDKTYSEQFKEAKTNIEQLNEKARKEGYTAQEYLNEINNKAMKNLNVVSGIDSSIFGRLKSTVINSDTTGMRELDVQDWIKSYVKNNYNKTV